MRHGPPFLAAILAASAAAAQVTEVSDVASAVEASAGYADVSLSPVLTAGLGLGLIGDDLVSELGAQTLCLRALDDDRWLVQWEATAAFRAGILANTYPFAPFLGGSAHGFVELGHRFSPASAWSPYLAGRLAANFQLMSHLSRGLGELNTLNTSDGFGGLTLDGALRVAGGVSYLGAGRSLLLTAFVQEALVAPGQVLAGLAITEFGLGARFDLERSFTVSLEALAGLTPVMVGPAQQTTDQKVRLGVSGTLRKSFGETFWMGVSASYARDSDHLVYPLAGTAYDTVHPGNTSVTLAFGLALWRPR
jgi:hypothetical protein